MAASKVPPLIWELVENQLDDAYSYELRCLVGSDLVEQGFELRNEILCTLDIGKNCFFMQRKIESLQSESVSSGFVVEKTVRLFLKVYSNENATSSNVSSMEYEKCTGEDFIESSGLEQKELQNSCIEIEFKNSLSNLRSCLHNEKQILENYLQTLQSALLDNFQSSNSLGDHYGGTNRAELVNSYTLQNGDGEEVALPTSSPGIRLLHRKRQSSHSPKTSKKITDNLSESSTTRSPTFSSNSLACLKGTSSAENKPILSTLETSNRSFLTKNTATNRIQMLRPPTSKPHKDSIHSNANVSFPPLTESTVLVSSKTNPQLIQTNGKISCKGSKRNSNPSILERYNSAQRFRQMVLKTRQQNDGKSNQNDHN